MCAGAAVNGVPMSARKHAKTTSLPLETPLHSAARLPPNAAAPLVRRLLAAKADANRVDQFGQTPLHVAAVSSALEPCAADRACSIMVEESAAPATADATVAAIEALLEGGADKLCKDTSGRTAYMTLRDHYGDAAPSRVADLLKVPGANPS